MLLKLFTLTNLLIISVLSLPFNKDDFEKNKLSEEDLSSSEELEYKYEETKIAEKILQSVLEEIYDKYIEPNLDLKQVKVSSKKSEYSKFFDQQENEENTEKMLGDLPVTDTVLVADSDNLKNLMATLNKNSSNLTNPYVNFRNNFTAERENPLDIESVKKQWLMFIQQSILERVGRNNNITSVPPSITEPVVWILNRTGSVPTDPNPETESNGDEFVNKKIRSFYPSCDIPRNTDEDVWKDTNTMNLYFNVDYTSGVSSGVTEQGQEDTVNIASATLRLYRLPQENATTENNQKSNNAHSLSDDDKQIRVSVYWYSRSLKKHKAVKRRLADSRMVLIHSNSSLPRQFVEFNVRPAAKTWVRGRNLGLGIVVEDVDGNHLNPGDFFKGAQCDTVGNVSTPIPIPTPFLDGLANNTLHTPYDTLMPNLDICTIEIPHNLSGHHPQVGDTSKILCRVLTTTEEVQRPSQRDVNDTERHFRHHHTPDFRDKFVGKRVVVKNSQINNLDSQISGQNISEVNR